MKRMKRVDFCKRFILMVLCLLELVKPVNDNHNVCCCILHYFVG